MIWQTDQPNKISLQGPFGLGDSLLATVPMGAIHQRDPRIMFEVCCNHYPEIFKGLPFVSRIVHAREILEGYLPLWEIHSGDGEGYGGILGFIPMLCRKMGIEDIREEERRVRYSIKPEEVEFASCRLRQLGWSGEPILGVQMHGGWRSKRWIRWRHLVALAQKE